MADLLKNASELIQSEGFTGAHSLIFLIRYAFLAEKKSLMKLIGKRRGLMKYVKQRDIDEYRELIKRLGIRDNI